VHRRTGDRKEAPHPGALRMAAFLPKGDRRARDFRVVGLQGALVESYST